MSDQQIMTLALSILIPLSVLIYSNSRISDVKEVLRAEMALQFEKLSNKMAENHKELLVEIRAHEAQHH